MNYKDAYEYGIAALQKEEIADANIDARLLLEFVCHTNRTDLYVHPDREIEHEEFERYLFYIMKRQKHIPLQYITNEQEFMGIPFYVNEHVLIPRQDTEVLVEHAMTCVHDGMKILDMCTGSGCILLSLLKYSNDCVGTGVDVSEQALEVAKKNSLNLEIDANFILSDLFEELKDKEKEFDLIVSNPPYIPPTVIETLMDEVKLNEPRIALDGGIDGLDFYRKIADEARSYLVRGGSLIFEIGYEQGQAVSQILAELGYIEIGIKKDLAGLDRVVHGTFLEEKNV